MELKKTNLLKFQQDLNQQFLEIFYEKLENKNQLEDNQIDFLGLVTNVKEINFFVPLHDMKNIAIKNLYENSVQTKSWVEGFNQEYGEVYTILNFEKIIDLVLENKTDYNKNNANNTDRLIYLQTKDESNYGLILQDMKLEYTAEYTKIFEHKIFNQQLSWNLVEDIDFQSFIKKENMSLIEYEIISKIYDKSQSKEIISLENILNSYSKDLFLSIIENVYLDSLGKKPIFIVNIDNLIQYLNNTIPF